MLKFISGVVVLFLAANSMNAQEKHFDIIKNMEIFTNVYKELNQNYVDDIDPGELMKIGIDAMMNSLDPYTIYYSSSQVESSQIEQQGKYEGLGILVRQIEPYTVVSEVTEGGPADAAGMKIADQITKINGTNVVNYSDEEVSRIMQGAPGTTIQFTVLRPGENDPIDLVVSRDQYNVSNVPVYELVGDDVAYVKLTTFTPNAGKNVQKAIADLKKKEPNLKGVILDLRYNGGGLLREAVSLSNVFIPKGKEIVSTRGKIIENDRTLSSQSNPYDVEIPLAVLINNRSASASEIVSGVIQDYDRGVLIGQGSYGKGLVQNFSDVGFNSQIKLTTAKYYIPSGRCIQSVEYDNGEPVDIPLDKRSEFYTEGGRVVHDGGGVRPDVELKEKNVAPFVQALLDKHVVFTYVTKYMLENPIIESAEEYSFDKYDEFVAYAKEVDFSFEKESEKQLAQLKEKLESENLDDESKEQLENLEKVIAKDKADDFEEFKSEIIELIEDEVVLRVFYEKGKIRRNLDNDDEINKAIEILKNDSQYKKLLS